MNILSISSDPKTIKGEKYGFLTGIIYLAPSDQSGVMNTCPFASIGCRSACLFSAGHGAFKSVINARINKTIFFRADRAAFISQLNEEIKALEKKAQKKGLTPAVRLNGTSDLPFENFGVIEKNPDVIFYDYTKSVKRMLRFLNGEMPKNYHLTFSRSESNQDEVLEVLKMGGNVAVVFDSKDLPKVWQGKEVINADESDLRFLDKKGVICGLYAKGKARKEQSGFVVSARN